MASLTEAKYPGDIVLSEWDPNYNREEVTLLAGADQVNLVVGSVMQDDGAGKKKILAAATNEVQTVTTTGTSTAGSMKLRITLASGAEVWTDTIAWSATEATMTASVNTALDALLGAAEIVCSTIVDTGTPVLVLTFSGAAFAGLAQPMVGVDISALTGAATVDVAETTKGSSIGSLSDSILLFIKTAATASVNGAGVALVRGPATVKADEMTYHNGTKAGAIADMKTWVVPVIGLDQSAVLESGAGTP